MGTSLTMERAVRLIASRAPSAAFIDMSRKIYRRGQGRLTLGHLKGLIGYFKV